MTDPKFAAGTCVKYKCGSPTFVVISDNGSKVRIGYFNEKHYVAETFTVDRDLLIDVEGFIKQRQHWEIQDKNHRPLSIPKDIDQGLALVLGFQNQESRQQFLEWLSQLDLETDMLLDEGASGPPQLN